MPEALSLYQPQAQHLLLDLQRVGERNRASMDLVTSLGRVERDPSPESLGRVTRGLAARFAGEEFAELRAALRTWVAGAAVAWQIPEEEVARILTTLEAETMWERVSEIRDQVHRDGI